MSQDATHPQEIWSKLWVMHVWRARAFKGSVTPPGCRVPCPSCGPPCVTSTPSLTVLQMHLPSLAPGMRRELPHAAGNGLCPPGIPAEAHRTPPLYRYGTFCSNTTDSPLSGGLCCLPWCMRDLPSVTVTQLMVGWVDRWVEEKSIRQAPV